MPLVSLVMEILSSLSLLESFGKIKAFGIWVTGDAWVAEEAEVVSLTNFKLEFGFGLQASHCHAV